jgi:sugar lactone lactonase YvrE
VNGGKQLPAPLSPGSGRSGHIWRFTPGRGTPVQVVATPNVKVLNGLAADWAQDALYATDSTVGAVWKISLKSGTASLWVRGAYLEPNTGSTPLGANGIKVRDGAVWVSNTGKGTLLRIRIAAHGTAGAVTTVAHGLTAIDDFAFTGDGDTDLHRGPRLDRVCAERGEAPAGHRMPSSWV